MAKTDFASGGKLTAEQLNELGTEVNGKADRSDVPTADTLSGATAVGKSVVKAADAAAARAAIGAGTSNVKVGTGAGDALAGNTSIPAATPAGTRAQLNAGTDTTVRAFSAKDISEYVDAKIAEAVPGE